MRASAIYALLLIIALAVTGCSVATGASGLPALGGLGSSSSPAVSPSTASPSTPVATPAPTAVASPTPAASSDPAVAAIQAMIEKANQEQQDAFAKGDPTLMKDTATSSYYNQMAQINSEMANSGVAAIKLIKIEWGQVKVTGPTTAQATTFETWQTNYTDGSTDRSRQQNNYTLVLQQGSWLIQADDQPNSGPSVLPSSPVSGPTPPVAPSSPSASVPPASSTPASQADLSRNWSGYAATSGSFTAVTGTWTVPQAQSNGSLSSDATWVGIGGVQSHDLIQAGTMDTAAGRSGAVQYNAWVETLPSAARPVPFGVKPGDSVTVSIKEQGSNNWLIEFKNNTTGEDYQTTLQYASSKSSAEWIEEAPSTGRRILPIDNFGTVQFSGGTAVQNGKTVTIAESGAQPITLAGSGGSVIAAPSVLTPDGQGFSVSRSPSTPAPQVGGRFPS